MTAELVRKRIRKSSRFLVLTYVLLQMTQRSGILSLFTAQSVWQLATGWTVRGSNPRGARFSAPIQTGPGVHPASYTMGTGCFPGGKATGAWR
jgi:hypothetical protein